MSERQVPGIIVITIYAIAFCVLTCTIGSATGVLIRGNMTAEDAAFFNYMRLAGFFVLGASIASKYRDDKEKQRG